MNLPTSLAKQLEKVRLESPEHYEAYKKALDKAYKDSAPQWKRSNGQLVPIPNMNRFHISAAMSLVHKYALDQVTGTDPINVDAYWDCMPPVYFFLKEEMLDRGMSIPNPPQG